MANTMELVFMGDSADSSYSDNEVGEVNPLLSVAAHVTSAASAIDGSMATATNCS